jgi:hypothetical protein
MSEAAARAVPAARRLWDRMIPAGTSVLSENRTLSDAGDIPSLF